MIEVVLTLNVIWFAMGFNVFVFRNKIFAKVLVPREQRNTPVFDVLAESGKFLGGFNFAFALMSLLLLFNVEAFPSELQKSMLLFVIGVAHGTQFLFNFPIYLKNRKGAGVWQVKGTMMFIFVTDFVMMVLNLGLSAVFKFS